jgi:hypothetical protein
MGVNTEPFHYLSNGVLILVVTGSLVWYLKRSPHVENVNRCKNKYIGGMLTMLIGQTQT